MKISNHKNGLTLIELMVAIMASSIVILTVATVLIMTFQSWRINNAYVDLRRDAALAFYLMSRDIRESNITNIPPEVTIESLQLSAHPPARNNSVTYTKTAGGALTSTDCGTIIQRGVQTFIVSNSPDGDGVYITLGLANNSTGIGIAITNTVFVNTRN